MWKSKEGRCEVYWRKYMKAHVGRMAEDKAGEIGRGPIMQSQKDLYFIPRPLGTTLRYRGMM